MSDDELVRLALLVSSGVAPLSLRVCDAVTEGVGGGVSDDVKESEATSETLADADSLSVGAGLTLEELEADALDVYDGVESAVSLAVPLSVAV